MNEKYIRSFDNTRIATFFEGSGKPVILANGLGGNFSAWKLVVKYFKKYFRFFSWDYRGTFHSNYPENRNNICIEHHARDMNELAVAYKIKKSIIMGWSMGVQVALEYYKMYPDKVSGIVLINGTYGHPFNTVFGSPVSKWSIPFVLKMAKPCSEILKKLLLIATSKPDIFIPFAQFAGFVGKTLDRNVFSEVAQGYSSMDFSLYFELSEKMNEHSAEDVLHKIKVPTLIIHGEKDLMTPHSLTKIMVDKIPNAELFTVPFGSHYCILEFPDMINLKLEKFLSNL